MKKILKIITLCYILLLSLSGYAQNKTSSIAKPNIVFIITDDQGKNDLACEGNLYLKTPNLDKFYSRVHRAYYVYIEEL